MRLLPCLLAASLAVLAARAAAGPKPAETHFAVVDVKVEQLLEDGRLESYVWDGFETGKRLLVQVTVSGDPEAPLVDGRQLEVEAVQGGQRLAGFSVPLRWVGRHPRARFAFFVDGVKGPDPCRPVEVTARITGQPRPSSRTRSIQVECSGGC